MKTKDSIFGKIPEHWDIKKASEQLEIITDYVANGSFASLAENVNYLDGDGYAILVRTKDHSSLFDKSKFVYIDEHAYNFLSKSKLFGGETIISNVGDVGTVFKCPKLDKPMSLGPNCVTVKFKGNDNYFYHWFTSHYGQESIKSIITGSAQPKFNKTNFKELDILVPPLEEQNKIAAFLDLIDKKIETNSRVISLLDKKSLLLFNKFLDMFDNIPEKWSLSSLDKIAIYTNGLAMQKLPPKEGEEGLPVLKIAELRQGCCDETSDRCTSEIKPDFIVNNGDIIFSWSATLLVDIWTGNKAGLNQHLFKVTSDCYDKWFYYYWTRYHLKSFIYEASSKATTMGHITRDRLTNAQVLIPDKKTYDFLGNILSVNLKEIENLRLQNNELLKFKKNIMTKLLTGQISISR